MRLSIRRACEGDESLIHRFVCDLSDYEKLRHEVIANIDDLRQALFGAQPRVYCELAESNGVPCGMALWFYNFSTFHGKHGIYLEDLFVSPEFRGRGVGKALLKHLAQICHSEGLTRLQWWVLDWNQPSIDFYKSLGAEPQDEWTVFRIGGQALTRLAEA